MIRSLFLIAISIACGSALFARNGLAGLWEGRITEGGIYSEQGHRFEIFLQVKNGHIKGQSYIYISQDSVITRRLSGRMYEDRSIYLEEIDPNLIGSGKDSMPEDGSPGVITRKYQVLFNRSIWDTNLEGYWQEITPHSFNHKRQRGRVKLKKKERKAKA